MARLVSSSYFMDHWSCLHFTFQICRLSFHWVKIVQRLELIQSADVDLSIQTTAEALCSTLFLLYDNPDKMAPA